MAGLINNHFLEVDLKGGLRDPRGGRNGIFSSGRIPATELVGDSPPPPPHEPGVNKITMRMPRLHIKAG